MVRLAVWVATGSMLALLVSAGCGKSRHDEPLPATPASAGGESGAPPSEQGGGTRSVVEAAAGAPSAPSAGGAACVAGEGLEQWQDGIDTDCDGQDDPWDCAEWPNLCGCPEMAAAPETTPVDEQCELPDLVIRSVVRCKLCAGPWIAVVLENRGQAPAEGVTLELTSKGDSLPPVNLPQAIEPGAVALPINVYAPEGKLEVTVRSDAADCDPADNTKTYDVPFFTCK